MLSTEQIILGVTIVVILVLSIIIIVVLTRPKASPPTPGPPTPSPQVIEPTLFLYPESSGFNMNDFDSTKQFPSGEVIKNGFNSISVVANRSADDWKDHWTDPKVTQLIKKTGLPLVKWVAYYFGKTGNLCACNYTCNVNGQPGSPTIPCCGGPDNVDKETIKSYPQNCYTDVVDLITKEVKENGISGVLYDDEENDPSFIVQALNKVRDNIPGLKLAWSKDLGATHFTSPGNKSPNKEWDFSLGQAYTGDLTNKNLYGMKSCSFSPEFWNQLGKILNGANVNRAVPMLCGAGNCQEIPQNSQQGDTCIDERMTSEQIEELLKKRPPDFKWKNFAIWYGKFPGKWSNCYGNDGKCCFNDKSSNCDVGCCGGWLGKVKSK